MSALGAVVVPIQGINKAASASLACFKIIDAPQLKEGGLKAPEAQATSDIRFENVRFTYPSRPRTEIVKGMNLALPAGKITALVGPSGCGKSTIVGLLERWYQISDVNDSLPFVEEQNDDSLKSIEELKAEKKAKKEAKKAEKRSEKTAAEIEQEKRDAELGPILQNSGNIFVGQHNIETLDRKWWRSQIGLVQQEPFLFNETIQNNVARGLIGSQWQDEPGAKKQKLVEEACKEAFADEFIRRLPDGYKTLVGESGIKLSGGQRQRLAIARSIIKRPAILILDEATSSIDVRGERIVQAALDRVSKNRTTIIIAHRLSTIRKADHIVVLKEGVTVEEGTHDELVTREDGVYANLVRAQHLELGGTENEHAEALEQATKVDAGDLVLEKTKSKASKLGRCRRNFLHIRHGWIQAPRLLRLGGPLPIRTAQAPAHLLPHPPRLPRRRRRFCHTSIPLLPPHRSFPVHWYPARLSRRLLVTHVLRARALCRSVLRSHRLLHQLSLRLCQHDISPRVLREHPQQTNSLVRQRGQLLWHTDRAPEQ